MEIKSNMTCLVAGIFILISVIRFPVGNELRPLFDFLVRVGVVIIFAFYLMKTVNLWVGLFLLLAVFSHSIPWFHLTGYKYIQTQQSFVALDSVIVGCLLYTVLVKTEINYNVLLNMMCILVLINVVFVALQTLTIDPYRIFHIKGNCSPTGLMANKNELSAFIAICSPAFFRKGWAWLLPIVISGLWLARSLNGAIGFASVLFLFLTYNENKFLALMIPFFFVATFWFLDDRMQNITSISDRFYIWHKALTLNLKNQPILGFGLGNWNNVNTIIAQAGEYKDGMMYSRVHNTFIQGYVEMGVGFVILLIGYSYSLFKQIKKENILPLLALAAIFVCCNTNSLFQMNAINGIFVILWLSMLNGEKNEKSTINYI